MEEYLRSGREHTVNATRMTFGVHKTGFMFPMSMAVKVMPPGFGATIQPIAAGTHGFALFMEKSAVLTACCERSLELFGVGVDALGTGDAMLAKWIPTCARIVLAGILGSRVHVSITLRTCRALVLADAEYIPEEGIGRVHLCIVQQVLWSQWLSCCFLHNMLSPERHRVIL